MIDDIEEKQSHVDWMNMARDRAAYSLRDQYDKEVLGYMSGYKQSALHANADTARTAADIPGTKAISSAAADEILSSNHLKKGDFARITTSGAADHSIPIAPRLPGVTSFPTDVVSPLDIFNRAARLLDQQNVPREGRWAVVDPVFLEVLRDEDSKLFMSEWGKTGGLRNGMVTETPIQGFTLFQSQNLPIIGTGPATSGTANQNTNFGVLLFGNDQAVATAEQISKTETVRPHDTFGTLVKGMHLYGRKILRGESLVVAKYNVA